MLEEVRLSFLGSSLGPCRFLSVPAIRVELSKRYGRSTIVLGHFTPPDSSLNAIYQIRFLFARGTNRRRKPLATEVR